MRILFYLSIYLYNHISIYLSNLSHLHLIYILFFSLCRSYPCFYMLALSVHCTEACTNFFLNSTVYEIHRSNDPGKETNFVFFFSNCRENKKKCFIIIVSADIFVYNFLCKMETVDFFFSKNPPNI